MATPPTRQGFAAPTGNFTSTTSPKTTTTSLTLVAGDLLVVIAQVENGGSQSVVTPTVSAGTVTWTQRVRSPAASDSTVSGLWVWTGAVTAGGTATVSLARPTSSTTIFWGFTVTQWRNHGGVGAVFNGNNGTGSGAPSVAMATSANSAVQCGVCDWNEVAPTGYAWRAINGTAESDSFAPVDATGRATFYGGFASDTGPAGTTTQGLTTPSTMRWTLGGVEILGVASGSAFSGSVALSGSGTLTNAGTPKPVASQSLTGSGNVTAAGTPAIPGSESSTGSGSLSFGAVPGFSGPITPSGSGTLTLSGGVVSVGSAALSGAGTVTLGGTPKAINSTAPTGAGTLSLGGSPAAADTAPLTGSGVLSLSGVVGGGGTETHSGLVMLTGAGGLDLNGTPGASGGLSLGGQGFTSFSAAGRTMYRFDPPGKQLPMDPTGRDFLWSKVKYFRGDAVVRYTTGAFKQVSTYNPDEVGVDKVYLGGHSYTIDDGAAAELIQAGYGPYLTVVTS